MRKSTLKKLAFLFTVFAGLVGQAQNQYSKWFFTDGILSFDLNNSSTSVQSFPNLTASSYESTSSVADKNGNLLFFTNGRSVFNADGSVMNGGNSTLLSGTEGGAAPYSSSVQGTFIVKHPESDKYYIFTGDDELTPVGNGLNYSVVTLNGVANVTAPVQLTTFKTTEALTATLHANGRDIWILIRKSQSDELYAFLLTKNGIDNPSSPVVSKTGLILMQTNGGRGCLKFDSNGDKLFEVYKTIWPYSHGGLMLHDFDKSSGMITRSRTFYDGSSSTAYLGAITKSFHTLELSQNNQYLYMSSFMDGIYQVDVSNWENIPVMNSSFTKILSSNTIATMKMGPNNKLYFNSNSGLVEVTADFNTLIAGANQPVQSSVHMFSGSIGVPNMYLPELIVSSKFEVQKTESAGYYYNGNFIFKTQPSALVIVRSLKGDLVYQEYVNKAQLDLSLLAKSSYVLSYSKDGVSYSTKFIK